jgi:hypothetical protein
MVCDAGQMAAAILQLAPPKRTVFPRAASYAIAVLKSAGGLDVELAGFQV